MKEDTKREDGYYWVRWEDNTWNIAYYCFWVVVHWQIGDWNGLDSDFVEIDERRIVREDPA